MINAELECNARPLSPQMTEAFDKISKQVCSLSEQIAHLQLSVDGMQQPVDSEMAGNHGMPTASSSITQAQAARSPRLELEAQVGLSSGLSGWPTPLPGLHLRTLPHHDAATDEEPACELRHQHLAMHAVFQQVLFGCCHDMTRNCQC